MKTIMASALGGQIKVDGKRIPTKLMEDNGLLEAIRTFWKAGSRVMIISGSPEDPARNDSILNVLKQSFSLSELEVSEFLICDERNKDIADRIPEMDALILAGGHVPTQNAFLKTLWVKEKLQDWDGLLIAWSAGSMNCAETVYAGPELPGEAVDPSYERFIPGLGLTEYNVLPHYNAVKNDIVDGMRLMEDITYADSTGHTFYAITDGSYLLQTGGSAEIRGEAYRIQDGEILQISTDGDICPL